MEDPDDPRRRRSLKPAWTRRFADAVQNSSAPLQPPPPHFCPPSNDSSTQTVPVVAETGPTTVETDDSPTVASSSSSQETIVTATTATALSAVEEQEERDEEVPPRRFAGDGIDGRRPVMATPPVIDLTGSDSPEQTRSPQSFPATGRTFPGGLPPRLNREPSVIDLDTFNFESNSARTTPPVDLTGPNPVDLEEGDDDEDEVQFISENRRPFPQPPPPHPHRPLGRELPSLPRALLQRAYWGAGGGARNEISHRSRIAEAQRQQRRRWDRIERGFERHESEMGSMRANRRPYNRPEVRPVEPRPNNLYSSISSLFFPQNLANLPSLGRGMQSIQSLFDTPPATVRLPGDINYNERAFDPATAMSDAYPRPTYEPPPPVGEGFTRDPTGSDELVCPNCDHTLGTGEGLDKQVWAVRECGHVYCGFCASTRPSGRSKPRGKPSKEARPRRQEWLTQCEAEGCDRKTNNKGRMFQVYVNVD